MMSRFGIIPHYFINIIGAILPLLVSILTIPIYVHTVGVARYGIISIVWLLLGYAGFLDLGLARACENALARDVSNDTSNRAKVLVTAVSLNIFFGLLGAGIMYLAGGYILEHVLSVPDTLRSEIRSVVPWIAMLFPAALVGGVVNGSLDSRERFLAANVLVLVGSIIGQIVPVLCAVFISPSLEVVIPAAVMARAVTICLSLAYVYWSERPLNINDFEVKTAKILLGYGGWVTVSSIISPILVSLDQLIIGSRLGIESVSYYAVPMTLVSRGQIFAAAMSRTIFPKMSRLDIDRARELAEKSTGFLAVGFAAICGPAIIVAPSVLFYWMGEDFSNKAVPVIQLLLLGAWINGVAFIPFGFLQAQGRPDITAKFHIAELVPFVVVLWFASSYFGLLGAAAAWSARMALDALLMIRAARFEALTAISIGFLGFLLLCCYVLAILFPPSFCLAWFIGCLVCFAIILLGCVSNIELRKIINSYVVKKIYN